ncbi:MAG: hypothetical protein J7M30_01965, partial [Deltaproteobacteria bacterium]|nr:hypothetical protein [Deltaproteobacteria bacterium]
MGRDAEPVPFLNACFFKTRGQPVAFFFKLPVCQAGIIEDNGIAIGIGPGIAADNVINRIVSD